MGDRPDLMEVSEAVQDVPVNDKEALFDHLMSADEAEWEALNDPYHIQLTGALYNFSEDLGRIDGLDRVIALNEFINDRDLAAVHEAFRYYQLANAYSLRDAWREGDTHMTFFDSDDLLEALGYARAAVAQEYTTAISKHRETQSFVNFANILSRTGRVCEALVWYNRAIENNPAFGMALGNRGQCKMNYAALLFSPSHTAKMLHSAYRDFERALTDTEGLYSRAEANFRARMERIEEYGDEQLLMEHEDEYELGDTEMDQKYHRWVLDNHLYLNPLNDISTHTVTAHDYFHLSGWRNSQTPC